MGPIEKVFGGLLILFVVGAASYAVIGSFMNPAGGGSGSNELSRGSPTFIASRASSSAGASMRNLCTCYTRALDVARQEELDVTSPLYKSGFLECRAQFGAEGGQYWTAGWSARADNPNRPQSCRAYQNAR